MLPARGLPRPALVSLGLADCWLLGWIVLERGAGGRGRMLYQGAMELKWADLGRPEEVGPGRRVWD